MRKARAMAWVPMRPTHQSISCISRSRLTRLPPNPASPNSAPACRSRPRSRPGDDVSSTICCHRWSSMLMRVRMNVNFCIENPSNCTAVEERFLLLHTLETPHRPREMASRKCSDYKEGKCGATVYVFDYNYQNPKSDQKTDIGKRDTSRVFATDAIVDVDRKSTKESESNPVISIKAKHQSPHA